MDIKKIFSNKLFANRLDGGLKPGIVGVSTTPNNIAMAYVQGTSTRDARVIAYNCVNTKEQSEQMEALQNFVEQHQLINCHCNYVLPVSQYVLGIIESHQESTLEAVKDLIDYPIDEAIIDIFPLPFKRIEDHKDVSYAVVTHSSVVSSIAPLIEDTGLNLKYIDIHELCLRNIIMLHPEANLGTLLLKLHDDGGHIVFIQDNSIVMSRRINLQLKNILEGNVDLQEWQSQTEEQKNNILVDTLTLDLQRSMNYSSSIFQHPPLKRIIITPTKLHINNIDIILTKNLNMPTFQLNLTDLMQFNKEISTAEQEQCLLAIGAGLRYLQDLPYETTN